MWKKHVLPKTRAGRKNKVEQWFELGTFMLEVSSSKPLASKSKGFAWYELPLLCGLRAIAQERGFYHVRTQRVAASGFPCHKID